MDCVWGVLFGLLIGIICWSSDVRSYKRYLMATAQQRTPVNINGHFYYVISEHEYHARFNRT